MLFKSFTAKNLHIKQIIISISIILVAIVFFETVMSLAVATAPNGLKLYLADQFLLPFLKNRLCCDLPTKGKTVNFGNYPQTSEGNCLPIIWVVVSNNSDGTQTLISKYALDIVPYDRNTITHSAWSNCSMHTFLNDCFFEVAFTEEEKNKIVQNHIVTKTRDWTWESEVDYSLDYVYIPGIDDIKVMKKELVCLPTDYAKSKIKTSTDMPYYFDNKSNAVIWWLRTPDFGHYCATYVVTQDGKTYNNRIYDNNAEYVPWDSEYVGVRPMIKIINDISDSNKAE